MDETSDPWAPLLYNLAGINGPPKARQAFQQYMVESYEAEIAPVVDARWKSTFLEDDGVTLKTKKNHNTAFRAKIAREMYDKLSKERQDGIKRRLKEAAQQAKDEYTRTMKSGPSKAPEGRQRCVDTANQASNMDETSDRWAPLLYNLAGINRPPKARHAFQQYMNSVFLEDDGLKTEKNHDAGFRAKIAHEMYSKLSEERQDGIKRRAKEAAQQARDEYTRTMKSGPSQAPKDRQRCIDTVGPFVNELLYRVSEYTGLQSVVVLGGPIPNSGGELETRVLGYSENCDRAFQDSERFDTNVLDFMKEFLHTAFTPEECAAAALPSTKGKGKARTKESEERRKERKERKERKQAKKRKREDKEGDTRGSDKRAREVSPLGDEDEWEDDWEDDMDTPASLVMSAPADRSLSQGPSYAGMAAQHPPPLHHLVVIAARCCAIRAFAR
ncbi:hypothetical protein DFH06DRAFT_1388772 [Mycena polygramma]|nr:hypothetical protein DFH06DRAFT_1388772 [Mycena polygramma]